MKKKMLVLVFILPMLLILQSSAYAQMGKTRNSKGTNIEATYQRSVSVKDAYKPEPVKEDPVPAASAQETAKGKGIIETVVDTVVDFIKNLFPGNDSADQTAAEDTNVPTAPAAPDTAPITDNAETEGPVNTNAEPVTDNPENEAPVNTNTTGSGNSSGPVTVQPAPMPNVTPNTGYPVQPAPMPNVTPNTESPIQPAPMPNIPGTNPATDIPGATQYTPPATAVPETVPAYTQPTTVAPTNTPPAVPVGDQTFIQPTNPVPGNDVPGAAPYTPPATAVPETAPAYTQPTTVAPTNTPPAVPVGDQTFIQPTNPVPGNDVPGAAPYTPPATAVPETAPTYIQPTDFIQPMPVVPESFTPAAPGIPYNVDQGFGAVTVPDGFLSDSGFAFTPAPNTMLQDQNFALALPGGTPFNASVYDPGSTTVLFESSIQNADMSNTSETPVVQTSDNENVEVSRPSVNVESMPAAATNEQTGYDPDIVPAKTNNAVPQYNSQVPKKAVTVNNNAAVSNTVKQTNANATATAGTTKVNDSAFTKENIDTPVTVKDNAPAKIKAADNDTSILPANNNTKPAEQKISSGIKPAVKAPAVTTSKTDNNIKNTSLKTGEEDTRKDLTPKVTDNTNTNKPIKEDIKKPVQDVKMNF